MAGEKVTIVSAELQKLRKELLIDLILSGKLTGDIPKTVNIAVIQKYLSQRQCQLCNDKVSTEVSDIHDDPATSVDTKGLSNHLATKTESAGVNSQSDALNKLTFHLEKRVSEQELLISLLQDKINSSNVNNPSPKPKSSALIPNKPLDSDMALNPQNNCTLNYSAATSSSTHLNSAYQQKHTITNAQVNKAIKDAKKPTVFYITGSNASQTTIKSVPKQGYLSVYRLHPETTNENLEAFLKVAAPDIPFRCTLLKSNMYQSCFKVSFPLELLEKAYNPQIWPDGAAVRKFTFDYKNFQKPRLPHQNHR